MRENPQRTQYDKTHVPRELFFAFHTLHSQLLREDVPRGYALTFQMKSIELKVVVQIFLHFEMALTHHLSHEIQKFHQQ